MRSDARAEEGGGDRSRARLAKAAHRNCPVEGRARLRPRRHGHQERVAPCARTEHLAAQLWELLQYSRDATDTLQVCIFPESHRML
eukprot:5958321-Pleurochrysis_carterae.AAC.1